MRKKPKDLDELLQIYEDELCNRIYKYQLNNKIDIEIIFLCGEFLPSFRNTTYFRKE